MTDSVLSNPRKPEELKEQFIAETIQYWWNTRTTRFPDNWTALKFIALENAINLYGEDEMAVPVTEGGYARITHFDIPNHIWTASAINDGDTIFEVEKLLDRDIQDSYFWDALDEPLESMDFLRKLTIVSKYRIREVAEKQPKGWCEKQPAEFEGVVAYVDYFGHVEYIKHYLSFDTTYEVFLQLLEGHQKPPLEPHDPSILDHFEPSIQKLESDGDSRTQKIKEKVAVFRISVEAFRKTDWRTIGTWMYSLREQDASAHIHNPWSALETKEDYEETLRAAKFHGKKKLVFVKCWQSRLSRLWRELKNLENEYQLAINPPTYTAVHAAQEPQDLQPLVTPYNDLEGDIWATFSDKAFEDEEFSFLPRDLSDIKQQPPTKKLKRNHPLLPVPLKRSDIVPFVPQYIVPVQVPREAPEHTNAGNTSTAGTKAQGQGRKMEAPLGTEINLNRGRVTTSFPSR